MSLHWHTLAIWWSSAFIRLIIDEFCVWTQQSENVESSIELPLRWSHDVLSIWGSLSEMLYCLILCVGFYYLWRSFWLVYYNHTRPSIFFSVRSIIMTWSVSWKPGHDAQQKEAVNGRRWLVYLNIETHGSTTCDAMNAGSRKQHSHHADDRI